MKNNRSCPILLSYCPHGLSTDIFHPIKPDNEELLKFKKGLIGDKEFDFILLFNSRNIRRKSIPDIILSWKLFIDRIPKADAKKCLLLLHTQPVDQNGTDLIAVIEYLCPPPDYNVLISPHNLNPQQMNMMYNLVDGVILLSSAEGWGLALTESMLTGTPFIANVTGGMQDQMRFEYDMDEGPGVRKGGWIDFDKDFPSNHMGTYKKHGEWAFPVHPNNLSVVGSVATPYIYDDRCDFKEAYLQIKKLWEMGNEERKRIGEIGRKWAISDEAGFTAKKMTNRIIGALDELFDTWIPRENIELYKDTDYKTRELNHTILY